MIFGSELPGISDELMAEADEYLKIPMYGFTESFNISVSAAIILHTLSDRLRNMENVDWELNTEEKDKLKYQWIKNTIKRSELLEDRFWKEKNQQFPK